MNVAGMNVMCMNPNYENELFIKYASEEKKKTKTKNKQNENKSESK